MRFRRRISRDWKRKFEGSPGNDKPGALLRLFSFNSDPGNCNSRSDNPSLLLHRLPIEHRESVTKIQAALSYSVLLCFLLVFSRSQPCRLHPFPRFIRMAKATNGRVRVRKLATRISRNRVSSVHSCEKIRVPRMLEGMIAESFS